MELLDVLRQDGLVVLRGILPNEVIAQTKSAAEAIYSQPAPSAGAGPGSFVIANAVERYPGIAANLTAAMTIAQQAAARAVAGFRTEAMLGYCVMRRQTDRSGYTGWHIDADGVETFFEPHAFNIWIPLDPVDGLRPGLQLITGSNATMRKLPLKPGPEAGYSVEWVAATFPGVQPVTPRLEAGDAIVFDHYTLHRTEPMDGLPRMSLECRVRQAQ